MESRRTITWGDELVVAAHHAPGGLRAAVEQIQRAVGPRIGTRNTFAKLYSYESPDDLNAVDRYRAWLLVSAFGNDPKDWGLDDGDVPAGIAINLDGLRSFLYTPRDLNPEPTD
jgi:hypothetical protein